ncbi:MAG: cyclic nucleotide-binding domain-containing protein [Acidobacteriota bacterium]
MLKHDLRQVELFSELDDNDLDRVVRCFRDMRFDADEFIVQEGEVSDAFYILREGTVAVFRDAVGKPVQLLARLRRGDYFGELGLIEDVRRTASVRAMESCRVLRITREDLFALIESHKTIKRKLQAAAARRHSRDILAALELGRRREVRIRFRHQIEIVLEDGGTQPAMLENLSLGGLCLDNAPEVWQSGMVVRFSLALRAGALQLAGRVAWRRGDAVGIAFVDKSPNHDMLIQLTIRVLLESSATGPGA